MKITIKDKAWRKMVVKKQQNQVGVKHPVERLVMSIKNLLAEGKPDCPRADECFCDGRWGWFAFDDPLNNAAGGKPWGECYCATDAQREAVEIVQKIKT